LPRQRDGAAWAGMMDSRAAGDLKTIDPAQRVQSIRLCGDTYQVTSANGATRDYCERDLRFKTDSRAQGLEKGAPG
jgi:cytochrome c